MSILQDKLTAVFATVVASGMIVFTGAGVAENKTVVNPESMAPSKQADSTPAKVLATTEVEAPIKTIEKAASKSSVTKEDQSTSLNPPPGPYLNIDGIGAFGSMPKPLDAPTAPIAPVNSSKEPVQLANSIHFNQAPTLTKKVAEPKAILKKPQSAEKPMMASDAPKPAKEIKPTSFAEQAPAPALVPNIKAFSVSAPEAPQNLTKKPKLETVDRPIWVEGGEATKQASTSLPVNKNSQQLLAQPMPNMGWDTGFPSQQYIYVPMPTMPSNMVPPQMPMFNGNMMPPANYWGANMQPMYAPNVDMRNQPTKDMGTSSQPTQKGNK